MINEKQIKSRECRHVIYCKDKSSENDLIVVNEYINYDDGTRKKNLYTIENMERSFWVLQPAYRNFEEKVQQAPEEYLVEYKSTQCKLYKKLNNILFKQYRSNRDAYQCPYLFGCAPSPQTLIKDKYLQQWPDSITPHSSVAVLDTETDVVNGTDEIILCSVTMKQHAIVAIVRSYLPGTPDSIALDTMDKVVNRYLGDVIKDRNLTIEYKMVDNAGEAAAVCIEWCHKHQPDFLLSWNMHYDATKVIEALDKYGYDKAQVFSDPRIPDKYKFFSWKPGTEYKVTQSGKRVGIMPAERWHILNAPATFFWACAMTTYYRMRIAKGKVAGGYGLDATLKRHLNLGKLKFGGADDYTGLSWHVKMQTDFPYEYIAYNLFDSIGVEMLDELNRDFDLKFNTSCNLIDYTEFKSGPRATEVKMSYQAEKMGYRWGVSAGSLKHDNDEKVVKPNGWTVVLPSFVIEDSNVKVIDDWGNLSSLVFFNVSDLDITSTYPNAQAALNISQATTVNEVIKVEGCDELTKRRGFVNMVSGISSSVHVCRDMFKMPTLHGILDIYNNR